jgi:peptidoglycan/LPS O-acetylase OafA/YrhL
MSPPRYAYIDALRGYAILMVIAVHSSQYVSDLSPVVRTLADQGARGVQLFFVASALTLCLSWKARHDGAPSFYIRRFFRIAPMYYLCLPLFLYLQGFGPSASAPDGLGVRHIIMALTFTHGFMPDTITSVVPGSWSIADEMIFYAVFPLLIGALFRARLSTMIVVVIAVTWGCHIIQRNLYSLVAHNITDPQQAALWGMFLYLGFINQLPCFLLGMLVFKWLSEERRVPFPYFFVIGSVIVAVWIAFNPHGVPLLGRLSLPVQYGAVFAAFALGVSRWQPWFLVNPVIGWIGKVSYSGYLVHLAVLSSIPIPHDTLTQAFLTVASITLAISSATFLCIEQPFNRLGHRVIARSRSRLFAGLDAEGSGNDGLRAVLDFREARPSSQPAQTGQ